MFATSHSARDTQTTPLLKTLLQITKAIELQYLKDIEPQNAANSAASHSHYLAKLPAQ
jgi:hypothetical protein